MADVFLSLGTNLGDKEKNLSEAIDHIQKQIGNVISQSAFYITAPWGFTSTHTFLNSVILIETDFSPLEVLRKTQQIEKEMGRILKSQNGSYSDRIIDIDILLYDTLIIHEEELTVPHPHMAERLFVMEPLAEIAPGKIHPLLKKSFSELLEVLNNQH